MSQQQQSQIKYQQPTEPQSHSSHPQETPPSDNKIQSTNDSTQQKPRDQMLKTPITLEEVKQAYITMKSVFKNRSVPGLVIALYDFLKLWNLPSRQQKMRELMQNAQNGQTINNNHNNNQPPMHYPYPQQPNHAGILPAQQMHYPNQVQPYNVPMNKIPENSQAAGMYLQPYPNRPRGRGRPPKNPKTAEHSQLPQQAMQPMQPIQQMQPKTKQQKQKALAQIFLYRGYGISYAKAEVTFPMDANIYYTYMRSILFKAFTKLEQIVASECRVQVTPTEDYKTIKFKSELCKCERWLQRPQLKTFQEYIRSIYDLNPQAVSKGDTIRLYRVVLSHWGEVKANLSRAEEHSTMSVNGVKSMSNIEPMM